MERCLKELHPHPYELQYQHLQDFRHLPHEEQLSVKKNIKDDNIINFI